MTHRPTPFAHPGPPCPRRTALSMLVAAPLGLAACGTLLPPANLKPPTLAFEDLSIDRMQRGQLHLKARIATHNPNAVDLPLTNLRFALLLYGEPVAEGAVTEARLLLPAHSELTVPVALAIPVASLRRALFKMARNSNAEAPLWEIRGSGQWGMIPVEIPFEKHGDESTLEGLWQWVTR